MHLVVKEILGWIITIAGIVLLGILVNLALNRMAIEAMSLSLPAILVFRGGLGLVKLATAGRIAQGLQDSPQP